MTIEEIRELIKQGKLEEAEKAIDALEETPADEVVEETVEETNEEAVEAVEETEVEETVTETPDVVVEEERGGIIEMEEIKKINPNETEDKELRSIANFIRTKGRSELRDVTTVEAEPVIPVDRITQAKTLPETVVDLSNLVNIQSVNTGAGSYPILNTATAVMTSVDELAENPKLANPTFKKVSWEVDTYRGFIPLSNEAIQDSDMNLVSTVAKHIKRIALNTTNSTIAKTLVDAYDSAETHPCTEVTNFDAIKATINKIDPAYGNVKIIMDQATFGLLDNAKDAIGNYRIQPNVSMASGKMLFGKEVIVLPNGMLPRHTGDKFHVFIGDLSEVITLFKRTEVTLRWQDHNVYGEMLACAMRFDVEAVNLEGGRLVYIDPAAFKRDADPVKILDTTPAA